MGEVLKAKEFQELKENQQIIEELMKAKIEEESSLDNEEADIQVNEVNEQSNIILLGLHASGKTTFIAALWQLLYQESYKKYPFTLFEPPEDRSYLVEIHKCWKYFKEVDRTGDEKQKIKLQLKINKEQQHTFTFLDVSGELFNECFKERHWDDSFDDYVKNADGVILFINPLKINHPNTISEVYEIFYEVFLKQEYPFDIDSFFEDMEIPWKISRWDANDSPSQVKLIELLQIVSKRCQSNIRLMIIVSAWDAIQFNNISPELWLARRMPLLMQYLLSNFSIGIDLTFFGLSAQGAPYKNKEEQEIAKQKLKHLNTLDRIIVAKMKNKQGTMFDILKWICE